MALNECTITGNSVSGGQGGDGDFDQDDDLSYGGDGGDGQGGAIYTTNSMLNIQQVTLAGNAATGGQYGYGDDNGGGKTNANPGISEGAGIYGALAPSAISLYNSIATDTNFMTVSFVITGHNLTNGNALLAPLGDYGGPTPTMPPLFGSPAIDAGADSTGQFSTDQRGFPRKSGAGVDIGAVEAQIASQPFPLASLNWSNGQAQLGFTNLSGNGFTVLASTNFTMPLNTWSNLGPAVETPPGSGQFQFTDPQATNYTRRFYRVHSP